jgi:hypothetical protein
MPTEGHVEDPYGVNLDARSPIHEREFEGDELESRHRITVEIVEASFALREVHPVLLPPCPLRE